jgi:PAS domain S-box-containing protein
MAGEPNSTGSDLLLDASLQALYEDAPCGYLFTRADGTIARVNRTFLAWTGYAPDDLRPPRRFQDLLTVPGRIFYENQYAPLLQLRGAVREVAFDILRPHGEPLPVLVNSVAQPGTEGRDTLIASTIFDATERRAYERELLLARRRAEELAAVVTIAGDAIVSMSPDGLIRTWNPAAERLFGRSASDSVGRALRDFLLPASEGVEAEPIADALRAGRAIQAEALALHADGRRIDVSVGLTPHPGALGEPVAISAIIRDISERRALERVQQEFLAMTSHELRNPLVSIRGNAQLMRRREAYSARAVDAIVTQADRLDRLVGDLLLTSQLAADRLDLRLAPADLAVEARAAAAFVPAGETQIEVEIATEPLPVLADRQRLGQVFANLLANALKYSPAGGAITVRVDAGAGQARVAVRDQGIGIPPEALPHLFDRFYRVAESAERAPGLGLGQIVEAHGGHLTVTSTPGAGSTFTVALPLATPPADEAP